MFFVTMPHSQVEIYTRFGGTCCLTKYGDRFFRNIGKSAPDYAASRPLRQRFNVQNRNEGLDKETKEKRATGLFVEFLLLILIRIRTGRPQYPAGNNVDRSALELGSQTRMYA